ncbi:MAG: divalent-cation tolerance protein CutA [Paracoccaceae bacterium]|nr:divalent-cation tolerance protein CutA [Paracoccaceae bacterium]
MPLAVYTTLHDPDAAHRLARSAVEARLAACVHIEEIRSVFRWEGAVQDETEYRLLFKTSDIGYDALAAHILAAHPYDQPALWALHIVTGSDPFFDWIAAESSGG